MKHLILLIAGAATAAIAQPVVAPTPQTAGNPQGENAGAFNITNNWEVGYRFLDVNGSEGKYRSDVNFGNGVRLLGGTLGVHSKNGKGKWVDELLLDVRGLGNDPYQFSSFRMQKNALYRYDLLWRSSDYFNPALTISDGNHFLSTNRRLQDHDFTLFPQAKARIRFGYSGNTQSGPGLNTGQWFDTRGDEFTYFTNVRRQQNEYRIGSDLQWRELRLSITRGWETFKDDTRFETPLSPAGANTNDRNTLTTLRRDEPYHGQTPFWRILLQGPLHSKLHIQGRFTHSAGQRAFIFDEFAQGTDRLGSGRQRQILVSGNGRRPFTTGSMGVVFQPTPKWILSNQTAYSQVRMEGDGAYTELANGTNLLSRLAFNYLGVRMVSNTSETSWQPSRKIGLFANYHFADRRVRSAVAEDLELPRNIPSVEQSNRLHAGTAGVRAQPTDSVRLLFRMEIGRNNAPFYPTSDRDYSAYTARASYKNKRSTFSSDFRSFNNTNSSSLFLHSSRGRTWTANTTLQITPTLQFDAGYQYLHTEALTGLAYFANFELIDTSRSFYVSNIHTVHSGLQWQIRKKVDLFAGLVRTQDVGDRRATALATSRPDAVRNPDTAALFFAAQVYPLQYTTPSARVSVILHPKLRWNFGWQYFRYTEDFFAVQNYKANTGYVSLSYSF